MSDRRLHLFVATVALAGVLGGACTLAGMSGPPLHIDGALIVLGLGTLLGEAFPVRLMRRGAGEEFDVSSAFTLAALLVAGPAGAVAIQAVSQVCNELSARRAPIKAVFNISQKVLALALAGAAAGVFADVPLSPADGITPGGAAAFATAAAVYIAVNGLLVTVVCALAAGEPVIPFVRRELARDGLNEVLIALLAPVAVTLALVDPLLVALLAVPAWALRLSGQQGAANYALARHDPLTGLPNRVKLREDLQARLAGAGRTVPRLAVLVTDLDRFKEVNDTLGHDEGDRVLAAVARRMADAAGDAALHYRLEGDEFGVLAAHDASRALELATRLVHAFQAPLAVGGLSLELGLAVGVAVAGEDADTIEELLRRADVALAAAKDDHSGVALYAPDRDRFSRRRLALMGDLRRAIGDREVRPYFQPQVDLRTGVVTGAEALVRWTRPDGSMVPPLDFIPSAERSGLIKPLTVHVLAGALDAQQRWAADGTNVRMAVNLSARSLLDPDLVGDVEHALELAGAAAAGLELEVTESAIMAEPDRARRTLQRLDELGVRLAIDDFGTGHSSLAYLSRLPVHVVKIDRSFVLRLHDDPAAELIVRMTVDLGHSLGLTVVAEGIEDDDTRRRVRDLGCDVAQGFLWSPAVPADGFPGAAAAVSARLLTAPA